MEKIILTSDNFSGEILLEYDFSGMLMRFENMAELNDVQQKFLCDNFPSHGGAFNALMEKAQSIKVERIPADLSFAKIWDEYDYKVGKKDKASQLWSKLTTAERIAVFKALKYYDKYVSLKRGLDKQHFDTWLRNNQWEIDWKELIKKMR